MNVLVTGGFGYLGGRLVRGLHARGHRVVVSGRTVRGPVEHGTIPVAFDVLSPVESLRAILREHAVDAVVHLAALDEIEAVRDPDLAVRVSGEATRRLVEASKAEGLPRFVYMSTFHVYGRHYPTHIDEDTPTKASHPYSIAHLAGEGFCREATETSATTSVVLRMSNGYGAPADLSVDRWTLAHNAFCKEAVEKGTVTLATPGTQRRDLVWMDDVAQAADLVLRAPSEALGEAVFNVGGGAAPTIFELASTVARRASLLVGAEVGVSRPHEGEPAPALVFSIERLRALGYVPHDRLASETDALLGLLLRSRPQ